ncbi:hypothetical protein ACFWOB_12770 [Streptomyces sp. NPDC058420]|uniref:hypothetical protein n=1 Tax=Streptomyces sp. NPDC058420 TaxID=3346489 RepID=UPI003656C835
MVRLLDVDDPLVRVAVAQSRHIDADTRNRLYALVEAERDAGNIDARVALNRSSTEPSWLREAPLDERMTYLNRPQPVFRRVLASCRDLPEEAWRRLDDDPDIKVRRTAARRPDTPPEVLERRVRAHGDEFHIRPPLVEHPNFPRHRLRSLVDEPHPHVRYVALRDPTCLRRPWPDSPPHRSPPSAAGTPVTPGPPMPCRTTSRRTRPLTSPTPPRRTPHCDPLGCTAS